MTRISAHGGTDPGRERQNNEDRFLCDPENGVFAVIDGVGGQAAGELAAELALEALRARLTRKSGPPETRIQEAIALANKEIFERAKGSPRYYGMACVIAVALIEEGVLTTGHVGDARIYLFTKSDFRRISKDHSPVGVLEDRGELTEREAMRHPRRNEIFREVGTAPHTPDEEGFIDIASHPFGAGDTVLLCSDGLSDMLTTAEIRETALRFPANPQQAVDELIKRANRAGGKDNITVVLATGAGSGLPEAHQPSQAPEPARTPFFPKVFFPFLFLVTGALAGIAFAPRMLPHASPLPPVRLSARRILVLPSASTGPKTIAEAMAIARSGDTVLVSPGVYKESIHLASGVCVISLHEGQASLRPSAGNAPAVQAENVSRARLTGFSIEPEDTESFGTGMDIKDSNVTIEGVWVQKTQHVAAAVSGKSHVLFRHCRFSGNRQLTVSLGEGATAEAVNSVFLSNGDPAGGPAGAACSLFASDWNALSLVHNIFHGNARCSQLISLSKPVETHNVFLDAKSEPRKKTRKK